MRSGWYCRDSRMLSAPANSNWKQERMDLDMLEITSIPEDNRKVPGYNKKLRVLHADIQNFQQRQAAFNARVERFNSNR